MGRIGLKPISDSASAKVEKEGARLIVLLSEGGGSGDTI